MVQMREEENTWRELNYSENYYFCYCHMPNQPSVWHCSAYLTCFKGGTHCTFNVSITTSSSHIKQLIYLWGSAASCRTSPYGQCHRVTLVLSVRITKAGKATGKAALLGSCRSYAQPAAVEANTHLDTLNQLLLSPQPLLPALEGADGQQFAKEEQSYPPGEDFSVLSSLLYPVSNPSLNLFSDKHFWLFYDHKKWPSICLKLFCTFNITSSSQSLPVIANTSIWIDSHSLDSHTTKNVPLNCPIVLFY